MQIRTEYPNEVYANQREVWFLYRLKKVKQLTDLTELNFLVSLGQGWRCHGYNSCQRSRLFSSIWCRKSETQWRIQGKHSFGVLKHFKDGTYYCSAHTFCASRKSWFKRALRLTLTQSTTLLMKATFSYCDQIKFNEPVLKLGTPEKQHITKR